VTELHVLATEADLRTRYREPHPVVLRKDAGKVDDGARAFIEASPFVVVATSSAGRSDASPRGGPPGFVAVLDEHRVAFGDLAGNNRLDTMTNIVEGGGVGLLFMVPGLDETLRVNGTASVSVDPEVLAACAVEGRVPKVAVVVAVEECYVHCAKAFRRAGMWDPSSWLPADARPEPECILKEHVGAEVDAAVIREDLERGYAATMWETGGKPAARDG
jgi:PPOX class probable FMN-dependent enzyme